MNKEIQENQEAIKMMARELIKTIKMMIDNTSFDKTKKCRIVRHIEGKYYEIQLDNENYKAYSPTYTYNENDIAYVKIAENNYNNLVIECPIK